MNDEHLELLISRIVDGEADVRTWEAIADVAADRPAVWRELAESQRDHAAMQRMVGRAQAVAETVPTPRAGAHAGHGLAIHTVRPRWWSWAGWAVAALVALAWGVGFSGLPNGPNLDTGAGQENRASLVPISSAQEAFEQYMDRGRAEGTVLSDEPRRLVVRTAPAPEGRGIEVIFIQQVMERTVVPDLYQLRGMDEQGRPSLVRYRKPVRGRM